MPGKWGRGVEIASPLGHGHLMTDARYVLPVQMSGRAPEGQKEQKAHRYGVHEVLKRIPRHSLEEWNISEIEMSQDVTKKNDVNHYCSISSIVSMANMAGVVSMVISMAVVASE